MIRWRVGVSSQRQRGVGKGDEVLAWEAEREDNIGHVNKSIKIL